VVDGVCDGLVQAAENLGMFPEIARRIQRLTYKKTSSIADLEAIVSCDVALTARILRLANSPYYRGRRTVTALRHALVAIGYVAAAQVSLALAMTSALVRHPQSRQVMRHSARTAVIARELARHTRALEPSEAFVAGMLHDLGKVVLLESVGQSYADVLNRPGLTELQRLAAERHVAHVDHAVLGEQCLKHWRFSCGTTLAVRNHHQPQMTVGLVGRPVFCADALIALADWVQHTLAEQGPSGLAARIVAHPYNVILEIDAESAVEAVDFLQVELAELSI
jgi:HD-like signal output (HDOD) protein